jgi:GT2 family glycosyltransferase
MVYIIVLNWKNAADTIACLHFLFHLHQVAYRIVVCDNQSPDDSYLQIRDWLQQQSSGYMADRQLIELNKQDAESYKISESGDGIYLVQTGSNLGFAGGNNVGIRFALNQDDMEYVWVLNNDTIAEPDSLALMVDACSKDPKIGICGCRLVYEHDRNKLQGLGGIYNSWLGTNYHYAANAPVTTEFNDDEVSRKIDYVIGASMLLSKRLLTRVGLFCEDYFLYFEELDITLRAKSSGFTHHVVSAATIYHKEGGSTGHCNQKSVFADSLAIRNRVVFSYKFYKYKLPFVWSALFVVLFNRLKRGQIKHAFSVVKIIFFIK